LNKLYLTVNVCLSHCIIRVNWSPSAGLTQKTSKPSFRHSPRISESKRAAVSSKNPCEKSQHPTRLEQRFPVVYGSADFVPRSLLGRWHGSQSLRPAKQSTAETPRMDCFVLTDSQ
jgi:hypothetical protein